MLLEILEKGENSAKTRSFYINLFHTNEALSRNQTNRYIHQNSTTFLIIHRTYSAEKLKKNQKCVVLHYLHEEKCNREN